MTNLTIRIEEDLKKKAIQQAARLGIPLSFIIKMSLVQFVDTPKIVIGEPQDVYVTSDIQAKMDKIGNLL